MPSPSVAQSQPCAHAASFERAADLLAAAREEGFIPALVVLWCNYVPNSWANQRNPTPTMPYDALKVM